MIGLSLSNTPHLKPQLEKDEPFLVFKEIIDLKVLIEIPIIHPKSILLVILKNDIQTSF